MHGWNLRLDDMTLPWWAWESIEKMHIDPWQVKVKVNGAHLKLMEFGFGLVPYIINIVIFFGDCTNYGGVSFCTISIW